MFWEEVGTTADWYAMCWSDSTWINLNLVENFKVLVMFGLLTKELLYADSKHFESRKKDRNARWAGEHTQGSRTCGDTSCLLSTSEGYGTRRLGRKQHWLKHVTPFLKVLHYLCHKFWPYISRYLHVFITPYSSLFEKSLSLVKYSLLHHADIFLTQPVWKVFQLFSAPKI